MILTLPIITAARPMPGHRRMIEPLISNRRPPVGRKEERK